MVAVPSSSTRAGGHRLVREGKQYAHSVVSQARLVEAVEEFVNSGAQPAECMIRDLIECEHSYINTDHPDFIGGSRAIAQVGRPSDCGGSCSLHSLLIYHVTE